MSEVSTGAKGAYSKEAPLEEQLRSVAEIKKDGDRSALHALVGAIHTVMQTAQAAQK